LVFVRMMVAGCLSAGRDAACGVRAEVYTTTHAAARMAERRMHASSSAHHRACGIEKNAHCLAAEASGDSCCLSKR
jgi:hypothetical protein